jgi:hypothetical protein
MSDETSKTSNEDTTPQPRDESRKMARRYFVKAVVYAAPAVASVVAVQHASAQASVCGTPQCVPGGACPNIPCVAAHCPC